MSSADLDLLAARLEQLGLPPNAISAMLNDPIALSRFSNGSMSHPQLPTHDNSTERVVQEVDAAIRATAEEAARPQRKVPPPPRRALVYSLNSDRNALSKAMESKSQNILATSFIGLPKAFSDKPVSELTKILFDEMLVTKTHKGRFLLCRIISAPVLKVGVSFAVEDESGRAEYFSVYNYPLHGVQTGSDLDKVFPLGQILLVREPTFKMNQNNTGSLIRVDSPSDFQFVHSSDPLLASARWSFPSPAPPLPRNVDYKSLGNTYFKARKYLLAVKYYSDGISSIPWLDQQLILFVNRSQAHLGLGNFEQTLQDTTTVLALLDDGVDAPSNSREKALLRRSRSYEGLRRFPLALSSYRELLSTTPSSTEAQSGVARVEKLLKQSTSGDFDWLEMARITENRRNKVDLLVGDFVGSIEARKVTSRGGGRGIFATKDIAPGELLLVETAFALGRKSSSSGVQIFAFDVRNRSAVTSERLNLTENIIAKILDNPSSISHLYSLSGGDKFPPSSVPPFDNSSSNFSTESVVANLDIARIESISSINVFGGDLTEEEAQNGDGDSTLFVKASLFNHRCIDNATWTVMNNVIVIRARTPIRCGEEVLLSYSMPGTPPCDLIIQKHLGSKTCGCQLCKHDVAEGVAKVEKRRSIVKEQVRPLAALIRDTPSPSPKHSSLLRQVEDLIAKIEATYSPSRPENLRPDLAVALHLLGESVNWTHSEVERRRSIELSLRSLTVCGGIVEYEAGGGVIHAVQPPFFTEHDGVSVLLNCARRYAHRMDPEENTIAIKWLKAAMDLERLRSGGGYPLFRLKHAYGIKFLGLEHLVDLFRP